MRRVLGLASFLFLVSGGREAGATSLAQECSDALFFISAAVVVGSAIIDVASAPASARSYNRKHLSIRPVVDPVHGSYGFSASLSFGRSSHLALQSAVPAQKSPTTAFWSSFASTTVPMLAGVAIQDEAGGWLFLSGLVIGPSVGHLYAGQVGRALGPLALRAGGTALGLYSIIPCFAD